MISAREIKELTRYTNKEIAKITGRSERTVEQFMANPSSKSYREMPESDKKLIALWHAVRLQGLDPEELIKSLG